MSKKTKDKVKQIKKAIGRVRLPPNKVIQDKREKLLKKEFLFLDREDLDY